MMFFNNVALLNGLVKVLKNQALYTDCNPDNFAFDSGNDYNLQYAFQSIIPHTHNDLVFVVACGSHTQPLNHIVDEYVRRRSGMNSLLPDVEMAPAEVKGLPDTHRILIFTEQLISLLTELTGNNVLLEDKVNIKSTKLLEQIIKGNLPFDLFYYDELAEVFKGIFEQDYVRPFYDAITYYAPLARSYVWCSTMVSKSYKLFSQSNN